MRHPNRKLASALGLIMVLGVSGLVHSEEDAKPEFSFKLDVDFMIRPEIRSNADFDPSTSGEDSFVGQRTRLKLSGEAHGARYTVQLLDGREWGAERKTGESQSFGMVQGYVELGKDFNLRIGRQEITWGKKRIIGSTGWDYKNLAAYDGLRFEADRGAHSFDSFFVSVAEFEIDEHDDVYLGGFRYAFTGSEIFKPEVYLLYKYVGDDSETSKDESTSMPVPGTLGYVNLSDLVLDYELILQSGTRAGSDQDASYAHLGATYSIPHTKFWLAAEYNYASGDDNPDDDTTKTFDKLYGINHSHYGYIDYQDPQNMRDLRFTVGAKWTSKVSTQLEYHSFELAEAKDRWYSRQADVTLQDPTGEAGVDVGSEIDLKVKLKLPYALQLEIGAAQYMPGSFVDTLLGFDADDSRWAYVQLKGAF